MPLIPLQLMGDSSIFAQVMEVTRTAQTLSLVASPAPATGGLLAPALSLLRETHAATEFTDGGAADGTLNTTALLPAGAYVLFAVLFVPVGFAEDTTCVIQIGSAGQVNAYITGTPSIFTAVPAGLTTLGVPPGRQFIATAAAVKLTITSASDITPVIAGAGVLNVGIYYVATV